jgi:hypothetical protein
MAIGFLGAASGALGAGAVGFSGKPGVHKPPPKLHGFKMKKFANDTRPDDKAVVKVKGPTGDIKFSPAVGTRTVPSTWGTWSNGYTGSVYHVGGSSVTITLPSGTEAFYLYVEPDAGTHTYVVKANGASSGPVSINADGGAKYFGFFANKPGANVTKVAVTDKTSSKFAIGEFGIR